LSGKRLIMVTISRGVALVMPLRKGPPGRRMTGVPRRPGTLREET
jgi:hypothetical protein